MGTARRWLLGAAGPPRARRLLAAVLAVLMLALLALPAPWTLPSGPGFGSPSGRPFFDTVTAALFWAAAANAVACALLLATAGLWARGLRGLAPVEPLPQFPRRLAALLLLAAVLALGLRAPLATGSVWWDEAWSLRRVVVGVAAPAAHDPGQVEVKRPPWSRPFWDYRQPTNHMLYSVLARASVDAWRTATGAEAHSFSHLAFRLPTLVATVASVILIGVALWLWGFPQAAAAAAFLLAIHPWHIRYGAEGRAYGLVVLLTLAACVTLTQALRSGSWRAWLAFGAAQVLLLWNQPTTVFLVVVLAGTGLLGTLARRAPLRDRLTLAMRCGVANLLAAMLAFQVMAPNMAQFMHWDHVQRATPAVSTGVIEELWSRLATGMPRRTVAEADPPEAFPSLRLLAPERPWLRPVVFGAMPLLAAIGLLRLGWRRGPARGLMPALLAGAALFMALSYGQLSFFYERFVFYTLVPVVVGLALGFVTVVERLPGVPSRLRPAFLGLGVAAGLAAYQVLVAPQTALLLSRPFAPLRDVAQYLSVQIGEDPQAALRGALGLGGDMLQVYDPWVELVASLAEVEALEARARRTGLPLFMVYGYPGMNQLRHPDVLAHLHDPRRYRLVARFDGTEANMTYRIFLHREGEMPSSPGAEAVVAP